MNKYFDLDFYIVGSEEAKMNKSMLDFTSTQEFYGRSFALRVGRIQLIIDIIESDKK